MFKQIRSELEPDLSTLAVGPCHEIGVTSKVIIKTEVTRRTPMRQSSIPVISILSLSLFHPMNKESDITIYQNKKNGGKSS